MSGITRFEAEVRSMGADGAEALRQLLLQENILGGLDETTREGIQAEARLRFGQREFSLAEAARVTMQSGTWDFAGGVAPRDLILHGACVAVFCSLASAPGEFVWQMTDGGITFRSRL